MTTTKPEVKLPELPKKLMYALSMHYNQAISYATGRIPASESMDWYEKLIQEVHAYAQRYGTLCYEAGLSEKATLEARIAALESMLIDSQNEARVAEESLAKVVQQREELAAGRGQFNHEVQETLEQFEHFLFFRMPTDSPHFPELDEIYQSLKQSLAQPAQEPIDMILHCPKCGRQHIDAPEGGMEAQTDGTVHAECAWENPSHRSHLCHGCGHIWRPADVPTNGVATIKTAGKADSPIAQQLAQAAVPEGLIQVNRKTLQGITDFLSANVQCQGGSPEEPPDFATQFDQQLSQVVDELQHMLNAAPDSGEG